MQHCPLLVSSTNQASVPLQAALQTERGMFACLALLGQPATYLLCFSLCSALPMFCCPALEPPAPSARSLLLSC